MSAFVVPTRYEDVTPEWLDSALRTNGVLAEQRVVALDMEPLDGRFGRTSSLAIIRPAYSCPGSVPLSLFAKFVSRSAPMTGSLRRLFWRTRIAFRHSVTQQGTMYRVKQINWNGPGAGYVEGSRSRSELIMGISRA